MSSPATVIGGAVVAVVIRMQRAGARNRPFWHIVVADSRMKRDGRFLEKVDAWVKKGAKPSVKVQSLIKLVKRGGPESSVKKPKTEPKVEAETPVAEAKPEPESTEEAPEAVAETPPAEETKAAE